MSVKWNGFVINDVDSKPLLEKILVTYHMYRDREISHYCFNRELEKIWDFLEEEHFNQYQTTVKEEN